MGKLVVTIGVGDQQGRQFEDLEVTVDTGSTFTAVPRALLQRLGVPVRRSARSRLADESSVPVDIGWTVVRLEDQIFATQVIFAEENQPSLLGVVTLEDALLAVDPVGQRLVPVVSRQRVQQALHLLSRPVMRYIHLGRILKRTLPKGATVINFAPRGPCPRAPEVADFEPNSTNKGGVTGCWCAFNP